MTDENQDDLSKFLEDEDVADKTALNEEPSEQGGDEPEAAEDKISEKNEVGNKEDEMISYKKRMEHWRKKAKDAEAKLAQKATEPSGQVNSPQPSMPDERLDKVEFLLSHPGTPKAVLDFVSDYAKAKGVSMEDAYQLEPVKLYNTALIRKESRQRSIPEPTARTVAIGGKSSAEMSKEEYEKSYQQLAEQAIRNNKPRTKYE